MNCVVVIPTFRKINELTLKEMFCLKQSFKVLNKYMLCIIGPISSDFDEYKELGNEFDLKIITKGFDDSFFADIHGYNRLLIEQQFYKAFQSFDYILIYQLDAFVFRDELNVWCNMKFDYIGAPWSGLNIYKSEPLIGVGNGGFSLRNVKSSLIILKKLRIQQVLEEYKNFNWRGIVTRFPVLIYKLLKAKNTPSDFEKNYTFQEDVFWCKDAPARLQSFTCTSLVLKLLGKILLKDKFKIAPIEVASQFSIETNPRFYYKLNNEQLPFGCHAWEKYDPDFWEPFIHSAHNKHNNSANAIS